MNFLAQMEAHGIALLATLTHRQQDENTPLVFQELDQTAETDGGLDDLLTLNPGEFLIEPVQAGFDGHADSGTAYQRVLTVPVDKLSTEQVRYLARCTWNGRTWAVQLSTAPEGFEQAWRFILTP